MLNYKQIWYGIKPTNDWINSTLHHLLPLFISSFLSLIHLDSFVYLWQKGGEYTRKYTSEYHHFYMTYVHTLSGRNSTSCTFIGGEDIFYEKTLFCLIFSYACFLVALWCFKLSLVSMLCCFYRIMLKCWTCRHPYAIMLYWLHVQMIICFTIWSL